jgi:hypothetical protein
MVVEMRTYKLKPGKRAEFLEIFRSKSMPAHAAIGMRILGPFLSIEDPDSFFFMRGFPDLASREPMKAKFYDGPLWKNELESVLMPMIDRYDVVVIDDTNDLITFADLPIACTLTGSRFQERLAEIAQLMRDGLRRFDRHGLDLNLHFAPDVASRVREMVAKEQACCAFLTFTITELADDLRLTITAPERGRDALDTLFEPFLAGLNDGNRD